MSWLFLIHTEANFQKFLQVYFLLKSENSKNFNAFFLVYSPGVRFWGKEMSDQSQYFRNIVFHQKQTRVGPCIERVGNLKVFIILLSKTRIHSCLQFAFKNVFSYINITGIEFIFV